MNGACVQDLGLESLPDATVRLIDQVCDGFEAAWRSGRRPHIEEFLADCPAPGQSVLVRELVQLDMDYRARAGETPGFAEYIQRFPGLSPDGLGPGMAAGAEAGSFAGRPQPVEGPGELSAAPRPSGSFDDLDRPRRLGKYRLLERVGVGSFGSVWRALDVPLNRTVALKIPHAHLIDGPVEVERFYREARAVAQLRHPRIVAVHDVMVIDGLPVLVCDFVTGTSLRHLMAAGRLPHRCAADLVAKVAEALDYAHSMGAIHRDVKPANIMIDPGQQGIDPATGPGCGVYSLEPRPGEPRIVDFGLACTDQDTAGLTHDGAIVGTPAYMSPELAAGKGSGVTVDHRTDVYSLGVVLYELLTCSLPFAGDRGEILHQVLGAEPPRPRTLDRSIPRDLETICLKAMAKEPRHRYDSARDLAEDLGHFLEGEPIRARPMRVAERLIRRAQRRPAEAALGFMAVLTALALGGLMIGYHYHRRLQDEYVANVAARRAETEERSRAIRHLYFHRMALAEREWSANNIDRVEHLLDDCPWALRGWEWHFLKRQCHRDLQTLNHGDPNLPSRSVTCAAFSPDGRTIATASKDGILRLWDAETGWLLRSLDTRSQGAYAVSFDPSGRLLASGCQDGAIQTWDVANGAMLRSFRADTETVYSVCFSRDGDRLATGHGTFPAESLDHIRGRGKVRLWDAASGRLIFAVDSPQNVMGVAFSPDGKTLASVGGCWLTVPHALTRPGELVLRDPADGRPVRTVTGQGGPLSGLAYHPSGREIATASWDRTIALRDASTGAVRRTLTGHRDWALGVRYSPDGRRLASAGADGAIKVWDPVDGRESFTLRGHTDKVYWVAFSPDGTRLVSASSDQTARLWDARSNPEALTWRDATGPVVYVAFLPDARRLLVAGNVEEPGGRVHPHLSILDTRDGSRRELAGAASARIDQPIHGAAISPDGRRVAIATEGGQVEGWEIASGRHFFHAVEPSARLHAVAFSPDGRRLAFAGQAHARTRDGRTAPEPELKLGSLALVDAETGERLWAHDVEATSGIIRDIAFSPDGKRIASADNEGSISLWDAGTGIRRQVLRRHRRLVSHVAFSADGRRLASASWDSTVVVWDLESGRPAATLQGHMRSVLCVALSPDGRRLATSSEDQTVKLWDADSGMEVLTMRGHGDVVPTVAFSADGIRLASAAADGTVQVREAIPQVYGMRSIGNWWMRRRNGPFAPSDKAAAEVPPGGAASLR